MRSSRSILWVVRAAWKQCCFFALTERVQTEVVRLGDKGLERVGLRMVRRETVKAPKGWGFDERDGKFRGGSLTFRRGARGSQYWGY